MTERSTERPDKQPLKFRSVFISDVHLGTRDCQADYLLKFLKRIDVEYLYLVGDIIDMWSLSQRFYWPQAHNNVLRLLLSKAKRGTRVIYIPGNHDSLLRDYVGHQFGNVSLLREAVHTSADGKQWLVTHGDDYEGAIRCASWLSRVGHHAYDLILLLNRIANRSRRRLGLPYWSLAGYLKQQASTAVRYIERYESALVHEAKRRHLDGVICGHIHRARLTHMNALQYINCGDWVESCTAIVEQHDGQCRLWHWRDLQVVLAQLGFDDNVSDAEIPEESWHVA